MSELGEHLCLCGQRFGSMEPSDVEAYLISRGWEETDMLPVAGGAWKTFFLDAGEPAERKFIDIPAEVKRDYDVRFLQTIRELRRLEGRTLREIMDEMKQVRVRRHAGLPRPTHGEQTESGEVWLDREDLEVRLPISASFGPPNIVTKIVWDGPGWYCWEYVHGNDDIEPPIVRYARAQSIIGQIRSQMEALCDRLHHLESLVRR